MKFLVPVEQRLHKTHFNLNGLCLTMSSISGRFQWLDVKLTVIALVLGKHVSKNNALVDMTHLCTPSTHTPASHPKPFQIKKQNNKCKIFPHFNMLLLENVTSKCLYKLQTLEPQLQTKNQHRKLQQSKKKKNT